MQVSILCGALIASLAWPGRAAQVSEAGGGSVVSPVSAAGGEQTELAARVRALLAGGGEREAACRALAELGPEAVPLYVGLLAGELPLCEETPAEAGAEPEPAQAGPAWPLESLLPEVLAALPLAATESALAGSIHEDSSLEARLVALGLLALRGGERALGLQLDIAAEIPVHLGRRPYVGRRIADALGAVLAREPAALAALEARARLLDPGCAFGIVSALEGAVQTGSPEVALRAQKIMLALMGRDGELDRAIAASAVSFAGTRFGRARDELQAALERRLAAGDGELRRLAAIGLGELGAAEAAPALVGLLGDEDPRVQSGAARALGRLARTDWPAEQERWAAWLAEEQHWRDSRWGRVFAALRDDDAGAAWAAAAELRAHPLWRRAAVATLGPLVENAPDPAALAKLLAELGDPDAQIYLAEAQPAPAPSASAAPAAQSTPAQ